MPISLQAFHQAASVKDSHALYVNESGVHDTGRVGTFFTRAKTFRQTTEQFLEAYRREYGDSLGNMASTLLQADMDAGKPLNSAVVRQFIKLGDEDRQGKEAYRVSGLLRETHAAGALMSMGRRRDTVAFMGLICGDAQRGFSDEEVREFSQLLQDSRRFLIREANRLTALTAGAKTPVDVAQREYLKAAAGKVRDGSYAYLHKAMELLFAESGPVQGLHRQLQALKMIEPVDGESVDEEMVARVCAALPGIEGELTNGKIFHALYPTAPSAGTTNLTADELDGLDAAGMKACLQQAQALLEAE